MVLVPANSRVPAVSGPSAAQDPLQSGYGWLAWTFSPYVINGNSAAASQTIFACVVPTVAGQLYTGVKLWVQTAGVGVAPTLFKVGLATYVNVSSPGTVLVQSANLAANAALTTAGVQSFPFSATYVETATGLRVLLLLENGVFGTTPVTFYKGTGGIGAGAGANPWFVAQAGTAQTDLPANGNALGNYSTSASLAVWAALY